MPAKVASGQLVRSKSAEGLRPKHAGAACTALVAVGGAGGGGGGGGGGMPLSAIPTHLAHHLSPPLQRANSSRSAAGAATERAPTSSVSAERGLMELAFEVGCGINVQRSVFVPAESPVSLLESLLKLQAA